MAKNVTFIIGNGFDLQMGLKTRWKDFYKVYLNDTENDSEVIKKFKNLILKDKENEWGNWSDFELGMGKESKNFNSKEEIVACHADFVKKFNIYIRNQCEKVDWDNVSDKEKDAFDGSMYIFLENIHEYSKLNFLQFNYTDIFDILLGEAEFYKGTSIGVVENLHIHGKMDDFIVIGVDNIEQIHNSVLRENYKVTEILVKQKYLKIINEMEEGISSNNKKAIESINSSDVICIFGSSIGETDAYWWKIIGNWLRKANRSLCIFNGRYWTRKDKSPTEIKEKCTNIFNKKREFLNRFAKLAEWEQSEEILLSDQITITLNSDMFNFELPMKETVAVPV
jgi:hypothetical protein